jgi:twitching motility protein PilT
VFDLAVLLCEAETAAASDLHLRIGHPPRRRVDGELKAIEGHAPIVAADLERAVFGFLSPAQQRRLDEAGEVDCGCTDPAGVRWRVNAFKEHAGLAIALRRIPAQVLTLEALNLPESVEQFAHLRRGLVLVTGATGSGKSSTLAALIDVINATYTKHVVTLEDPVEFIHTNVRSLVQQRAVYEDVPDFATGVRDALRGDVDVLMVGELRDLETTRAAISAAETGLLVFGTLHTNDAVQSIDRMIDIFPEAEQHQVRAMLAESLVGVLSQVLLKRCDGTGRVPATELMVATPGVSALIREGKTFEIPNILQSGKALGMHRLDDSLDRLLRNGFIDREEAASVSRSPDRFDRRQQLALT